MVNSNVGSTSRALVVLCACGIWSSLPASDGPVVWASYFGGFGWEEARALAVGSDGSVYVGGSSNIASQLPDAEVNAFFGELGSWDAVVVKISPDGSRLLWKAVLGG